MSVSANLQKAYEQNPSLRYSVRDGIFYALMFGAGESYLSAYGVALGLSSFLIGLLVALPLVIGSLSQLVGVRLMEQNISRRLIIVRGVRLQATACLIIAALPWLFTQSSLTQYLLIVAVAIYSTGGQVVVPAWTSLMGDLVPANIRGRYFGSRNQIMGYFIIASFIAVGLLLAQAQQHNLGLSAFTAVFLFAAAARYISSLFLKLHPDPDYVFTADDQFTLWQFIKRSGKSNFTRFVVFHAALNFGFLMSGPYMVVFMLRDLQFTYWQYSLVIVSALISNYMSMRWWGTFGDRYGNKKIIVVCSLFLATSPALWVFSQEIGYLIAIQVLAGCASAGIQIASTNFLLDAVSPGKRGRCAAYMNFLTALCAISGSLTGAIFLKFFSDFDYKLVLIGLTPLTTLFLVSTGLRLLVVSLLLPRFQEVREVSPLNYTDRFNQIARVIPLTGAYMQQVIGTFANRLKEPKRNTKTIKKMLD